MRRCTQPRERDAGPFPVGYNHGYGGRGQQDSIQARSRRRGKMNEQATMLHMKPAE
jgi:hypothetical protein